MKTKLTSAMAKHYKKAAAMAVAMYVTGAQAAFDVTEVTSEISGMDDPINQVGAATVGVAVIMYGWRKVRGSIR